MSNQENQKLENITRRQFLRHIGFGALRTGGIVAINVVSGISQNLVSGLPENGKNARKEARENLQKGNLKVKYFAEEIVEAANRVTAINSSAVISGLIGGYFFGDALGGFILHNYSDLANRKIGAGTGVSGKIIDYLSTHIAVKQTEEPRFKEYGLDTYFYEMNFLHSPHPSTKELITRGTVITALMAYVSWVFPFIGRGYLGMTPAIAVNNVNIGKQILSSLELGDKVKAMISQGKDEQDITFYLKTVGEKKEQ